MRFIEKAFLEEGFSLDRLRRLMDVDRFGYIAKAAGGDRIRANQISRQIGELEKFFGKGLRRKEGKLAKLNDEGTELAEITKNFFRRLDEFQARLDGRRPSVVVGDGNDYIAMFLIPKLEMIKKGSGNIGVSLRNMRSNQILEALETESIDIGIISDTKKLKPRFKRCKLLSFGYELIVPTKWASRVNAKNPLSSIFDLPFATLEGSGELRTTIEEFATKEGRALLPELNCTSLGQIATAIRSEVCCGILPEYLVDQNNLSDVERFKSGRLSSLKRTISLVWNPVSPLLKPYMEDVAESLRRAFQRVA